MADWRAVCNLVRTGKSFVVLTHVNPDGDAIGSQLALLRLLRALGKEARALADAPVPGKYAFLDRKEITVVSACDRHDAEVVFALDIANWRRLGACAEHLLAGRAVKVIIDHHPVSGDPPGDINVIDTGYSSTAELVQELAAALAVPLTADIAVPLYVGMVTDTGKFSYGNGLARAHRAAAELIAAGADPRSLDDQVYQRSSLARLRLAGVSLARLATTAGGQAAYTWLAQADLRAAGAAPDDLEGFIDNIRSLREAELYLVFWEEADGQVRGSLRSRGRVRVNKLAERLGGGGHEFAAGFVMPGPLTAAIDRALAAVAELLPAGRRA